MKKPVPVDTIAIKEPTQIAGLMVHDTLGPGGLAKRELEAWIVPGGVFVSRGDRWTILSWAQVEGVSGSGGVRAEDFCDKGPGRPRKE